MILTAETCVKALNMAALNRRTAFRVELAVGLGVFLVHGSTSREARTMLTAAYQAAGYECTHVTGVDYKTVNRRINATARLFEKTPVKLWAGDHNENNLLGAICVGLEPYEFFSVQDVVRYCSPQRMLPSRPSMHVHPAHDALTPQANHTGQDRVLGMFRRASDKMAEGGRTLATDHLSLVIPKDAPPQELIELAAKLLEIAQSKKELLTA